MIFHFNQFNNFPYQQKHIGFNQRTVTSIRAVKLHITIIALIFFYHFRIKSPISFYILLFFLLQFLFGLVLKLSERHCCKSNI